MLKLQIRFNYLTGDHELIYSDFTPEGVEEILLNWVRIQLQEMPDKNPITDADFALFHLEWDASDDSFIVQHECGHNSLALGTLQDFISKGKFNLKTPNTELLTLKNHEN